MKVSKKIFIIFSMILLLVSPVTSLGKDIKWVLERPVIPVLVKKPANPVMKITLIRTDNQPYVIRQIDLDLLGSTNVADIVSVAIYGAKKNGLIDTSRLLCNALPATQKMSFTNEVQVNQDSLSFWVAVTLKDTVSLTHRISVNCSRIKTSRGELKVSNKDVVPLRVGMALRQKGQDGIVICPGFGQRGIEGKIIAAHYTRTHDIPTFGICLGMQMMVIEFARNVLGYKDANSREMDEKTPHNVIDIMEEQKNISNMGGTMRLGAYECVLKQGSRVFNIYKKEHIQERHRHRYEFNNEFQQEFEKNGMMCVGRNPESDLVEIVEIPGLKWYVGTQYHPEYQSTVLKPHPLFMDFVKTAIENKK